MLKKGRARRELQEVFERAVAASRSLPIFNENRDFVEFEFEFLFYFLFDYYRFANHSRSFRRLIQDMFLDHVDSERKGNFHEQELDVMFDNRIQAYFHMVQNAETVGQFVKPAADYMNVLLTTSIDNNGYSWGDPKDLPAMKQVQRRNVFTNLIEKAVVLNSVGLL